MKEHDLPSRLHAWVIHGAPEEALGGSDQRLAPTAPDEAPTRPAQTSTDHAGGPSEMSDAEPDYVRPHPDADRHRLGPRALVAATVLAVVLVGGIAVVAGSRSTAPALVPSAPEPGSYQSPVATFKPGPCAGPASRGPAAERSAEQVAEAEQDSRLLNEEIDRTGFGFYSSPTQTGGWVCGWIPVGTGIDGAKAIIDAKGGEAIYDAPRPDAGILGYGFMDLGFFTVEEVQAPTFDPAQLRVLRYGCDTATTEWCRTNQTILGNGQSPEYEEG